MSLLVVTVLRMGGRQLRLAGQNRQSGKRQVVTCKIKRNQADVEIRMRECILLDFVLFKSNFFSHNCSFKWLMKL